MEFEWDENKDLSNIEKHGISFLEAASMMLQQEYLVSPSGYGAEERFIAVGEVSGKIIAVVYTFRAEKIRIISARIARRKERQDYEEEKRKNS